MTTRSFGQGPKINKMKEKRNHEFKPRSTPVAMVAPEVKQNTDNTEITKTCAVSGCDDYKNLDHDLFFRFPEELSLRQVWADLTGRPDWTPTDFSYICIQHFSQDSFVLDENGIIQLQGKAVPSVKLPGHVFEVEYIDEETLENDAYENGIEEEDSRMETEDEVEQEKPNSSSMNNVELLKLFTEVQKMQRQAVSMKEKLRCNTKLHYQQSKYLDRLLHTIEVKEKVLEQKKKKKSRILLTIQERVKDDSSGLVLAMPVKYTDDLKNFALSIYKYSPQSYVYARNTLRTMLPSTDVLESWLKSGFIPKNVLSTNNVVKIVADQSETELSCKVSLN